MKKMFAGLGIVLYSLFIFFSVGDIIRANVLYGNVERYYKYTNNVNPFNNDLKPDFKVNKRTDLVTEAEYSNPDWDRSNWLKKIDYSTYRPSWVDYSACKDADLEEPVEALITDLMFYITHVDNSTMQALLSRGWTIKVLPKLDRDGITGNTDFDTKTIYLLAASRSIQDSALHEIGHALTYEFAGETFLKEMGTDLVNNPEFRSIFYHYSIKKRDDRKNADYYEGKNLEAIAQSYNEYICYPDALKRCAPTVYKIWNDLTNRLAKNPKLSSEELKLQTIDLIFDKVDATFTKIENNCKKFANHVKNIAF